ncbi:MAG: hypothetical protein U0P30_15815 [Vicinamibacterales bacterium]
MSMRIAAPLLSLLGHELRAPAGVVGGYLALLDRERDRLSPTQCQALDGARRGQQAIVDTLDDLRRLTRAWAAESEPLVVTAADRLSHDTRLAAEQRRLAVTIQCETAAAVARRGHDGALAEALATVAEAVGRETGCPVTITTTVDDEGVVWRVRPVDVPAGHTDRQPFDRWRAGLGVRLVTAVTLIEASGGTLTDLRVDGARAGVDVRLPLASAAAAP